MADHTHKPADTDKAQANANEARAKALDAQSKANEADKSPEQRKADAARAEADKAQATASASAANPLDPMTAVEAKVVSPHLTDDMSAGDHFAQKFGNDPANPKPASSEHILADHCTVKLTRVTPDLPEPAVTMVHPDMVGDYLRAGWSRA